MIAFLDGRIILKKDKFIIIEVAGVGYKVFLNRQNLSRLPEGPDEVVDSRENRSNRGSSTESGLKLPASPAKRGEPEIDYIKLFIYHDIKEDKSDLYGFFTHEEMEFFETLMDIRGVGPRSALDISALGSLNKIKDRILKQDEKIFEGIPGIGSKKAMTIILELTGKIKMLGQKKGSSDEAEDTLTQLGFSKQQAKDALSRIPANVKNTEERVKFALKNLGR